MVIEILFNHPDEFVEELGKSPVPDDQVLRLTRVFKTSHLRPITHLHVVSTFTRRGQVVRLDDYVGDLWGLSDQDKAVHGRAEAVEKKIEDAAKALLLDVRGGLYRNADTNGSKP